MPPVMPFEATSGSGNGHTGCPFTKISPGVLLVQTCE